MISSAVIVDNELRKRCYLAILIIISVFLFIESLLPLSAAWADVITYSAFVEMFSIYETDTPTVTDSATIIIKASDTPTITDSAVLSNLRWII